MAPTVVAASTYGATSPTDPYTHSVPLPSGTEVGDTIVVGVVQPLAVISDSRLSVIGAYDVGFPSVGGAWGTASTLDDVEVEMSAGVPGLVTIVALREVGGLRSRQFVAGAGEGFTSVFDEVPTAVAAVAVVSASDSYPAFPLMGPADDPWTSHDVAYEVSDDGSVRYGIQAYSWVGGAPVPALTTSDAWSSTPRAFWITWSSGESGYLRQRQSPRANPRVSLHRPQLRARQRFQ